MPFIVSTAELQGTEWKRLRDIRLRSLLESPQSFASSYEKEVAFGEVEWLEFLHHDTWLVMAVDDQDVALMAANRCDRASDWNRDQDCFIHSCWLDPKFRSLGLLPHMIRQLDKYAQREGFVNLALGVWPENERAIRAYEKLGWARGALHPSKRMPGRIFLAMYRSLNSPHPVLAEPVASAAELSSAERPLSKE